MDIKFCSDDNIKKRVIDLLEDKLFSHDENTIFTCVDLLEQRYEQMKCNFKEEKKEWNDIDNNNIIAKSSNEDITDDVLLASKIKNCPDYPFYFLSSFNNWGHDLPIWIEKDGNDNDKDKMRIMIIAQDPLRTNCEKGYIYFSSPFGLHSKAYREKDPSNVWKIVNSILENYKVQIYLTDYYKFYTTEGLKQLIKDIEKIKKLEGEVNNKKYQELTKKYQELTEIKIEDIKNHIEPIDLDKWAIEILNEEIGIWKPQLILIFGKEAAKNLPLKYSDGNEVGERGRVYFEEYYYCYKDNDNDSDNDNLKVVLFPHPSGNNKKTIRESFNVDKRIRLTNEEIRKCFTNKFKECLKEKSCGK